MEMKQRIIGLVVLLALGVILVPLIFDSETVIKPASSIGTQAAALPAPPKKVAATPIKSAPRIILPGQIEASAEKMLDHQPQMTAFDHTDHPDFDDRDEEESAIAEADADESFHHAPTKIPDPAAEKEASSEEAPAKLSATKISSEKTAQLKTTPEHSLKPSKTPTLSEKSNHDLHDGGIMPLVWVVQLGVFSEVANANHLATDLKSKGFHAFVEHDPHKKNVHRVFIGPEKDRARADKIVSQLNSAHQIKSIVVRFNR